jgi:RNA polymerase sigma-70 factor (ECF subfamily)
MTKRPSIATQASLLSRLKNRDDHDSWQTFFDTYWRLIHGHAIKAGLTEDEAQEVVQETLIEVSGRIKNFHYDPRIGSFKAWLFQLTRWRIADQFDKRSHSTVPLESLAEDDDSSNGPRHRDDAILVEPDSCWEREWHQTLLDAAMEKLRERLKAKHFQVMDLLVVKRWPEANVARVLKLNRAQVYLIKFRFIPQLKKEIGRLEEGRI